MGLRLRNRTFLARKRAKPERVVKKTERREGRN